MSEDFKLVRRDALVRRLKKSCSLQPPTFADVALVGGKLFARRESEGTAGQTIRDYYELVEQAELDHKYDDNRREVYDFDITAAHVTLDPWTETWERIEAERDRWLAYDSTTELDREIRRFINEYPNVAAIIGIAPSEVHRLFPLGSIVKKQPGRGGGIEPDWRPLLSLHALGEHGLHGQHSPEPLSMGAVFTLGFQSVESQNRHAILTKEGAVRSRFVLSDEAQKSYPPPTNAWQKRWAVADIVTTLGRGGNRTLMKIGFIHEEPPESRGPESSKTRALASVGAS